MLDGIRGLAVLAVLWHHFVIFSGLVPHVRLDYHLRATGISGWVGVDLFFVLSGFLITGILYDTRSSRRYYFNFYGRRTLRILPLYYAFLAVAFFVAPVFLAPEASETLTSGQAWYWLYLSNIKVALDGWQQPLHLGHFWSLAVEEQFYLIWPLVVRALSRRRLIVVCIICFLGALGLRLLIPFWLSPLAVYVLMPTRMDAFAAGAAIALVARGEDGLRSLGRWPLTILAVSTGFALFLYWRDKGIAELAPLTRTVGYSVFAAGFAALIAVSLCSGRGSFLRRALASDPLVALGKYSYALYVFHGPIILVMRDAGIQVDLVPTVFGSQLPGLVVFSAIAGALSFACALLSWRFIEAPMQRLKRHLHTAGTAPTNRALPLGSAGKHH